MPILYSERLRLRAPEREDIPIFLKWVNDPDVCEHLQHYTAMNLEQEEAWYEAMIKGPRTEMPLVIEVREGEEWLPIGNIAFLGIHLVNRDSEIGIMIGEKAYWNKGYGTEAMQRMLQYGFEELNLHRIYLQVYEGNDRGKQAYKKAGFIHEGTMRQVRYHRGRYWDVDIMSILKNEWKINS
jgi:RimJ/RimL family protein N-acetyltransferase